MNINRAERKELQKGKFVANQMPVTKRKDTRRLNFNKMVQEAINCCKK